MKNKQQRKSMKVKFVSYYKYSFTVVDKNGNRYYGGGDASDIYRFDLNAENEMVEQDGRYYVNGLDFKKL